MANCLRLRAILLPITFRPSVLSAASLNTLLVPRGIYTNRLLFLLSSKGLDAGSGPFRRTSKFDLSTSELLLPTIGSGFQTSALSTESSRLT